VAETNRDKVFWPATGTTKGELIDYYRAVAEVMVPHLRGRPVTLRRWPDGVEGQGFFQKHAPAHRPAWMATVEMGGVEYLRIDDRNGLVWAANSGAIEIHPGLAAAPDLDRPRALVLDLDPGEGADVITCCRLALLLRDVLGRLGLAAWVKTSGRKGLQLYAPVSGATFGQTRQLAEGLARSAEAAHPDLAVSVVDKSARRGKVLIDWAQNAPSRTTVAAYSVRAEATPTVSTPVTWDEVAAARRPADLAFDLDQVRDRIDRHGDLMAPVLTEQQKLGGALRGLEGDRHQGQAAPRGLGGQGHRHEHE
jgi:bifunctional non-homologous end joining protein LigD